MIVGNFPTLERSIIEIAPPLIRLFVWSVAVTAFYLWHQSFSRDIDLPLALFGTALALFLGFRDNAAYARWWEARTLWGQLVIASRNVCRQFVTLLDRENEQEALLMRELVRRQIAYVHALRCSLRGQDCQPELLRFLHPVEVEGLKCVTNIPNAVLNGSAALLAEAARKGQINPFLWMRIESTFADIASAQGGAERIKATPLPMHFRSIPVIYVEIFCLLLPFAVVKTMGIYSPFVSTLVGMMLITALQIGNDLKDPFSNKMHDVPMTAMCRTIEIDLLQSIEETAPEHLRPKNGILM